MRSSTRGFFFFALRLGKKIEKKNPQNTNTRRELINKKKRKKRILWAKLHKEKNGDLLNALILNVNSI